MNTFFEFEENYSFEDEYVPGLTDFYRNYAIAVIKKAGLPISSRKPTINQLVSQLVTLAANGNSHARHLLEGMYREGLVDKAAA